MELHSAPPAWLEVLGWTSLIVSFLAALAVLADIAVLGRRQPMAVMNVVYPITALTLGPLGLWFYWRYGRNPPGDRAADGPVRWWQAAKGVSHCGAGCTLGDIGGEWLVLGLGLTIAGQAIFADFIVAFAFAWSLGIAVQYFSIAPVRDLSPWEGIRAAVKADTLSILAFEVGMFGGMAIYQLAIFRPPLAKTTGAYWFLMQISMGLGFLTAYPVNRWLIRTGQKERM